MTKRQFSGTAVVFLCFGLASFAQAHSEGGHVYWHIDPSVSSCSMVLDPSLTQEQWHTFTEQAGAVVSFKSLASAQTLGKNRFTVAVDYASTPVDQHNDAWINTFTHPDESCPLGDAVVIPTLRASLGVTDRLDVGGYWTTAPGANYGGVGGELKYAVKRESRLSPAVAIRASASILTGVPDFNLNVYSVDLLASKQVSRFMPYVGFRQNLIVGTETTSKVDLDRETLAVPQAYAGVVYQLRALRLAAEYDVSSVNTFALAVGFGR